MLTEHLQPAELSAAVFRLAQQALAAVPFTKVSDAEVGVVGGSDLLGDAPPGHDIIGLLQLMNLGERFFF